MTLKWKMKLYTYKPIANMACKLYARSISHCSHMVQIYRRDYGSESAAPNSHSGGDTLNYHSNSESRLSAVVLEQTAVHR